MTRLPRQVGQGHWFGARFACRNVSWVGSAVKERLQHGFGEWRRDGVPDLLELFRP